MTTQADEFLRVHSYLQAQGERHTFSELWSRMIRARVSVMDAVEGVSQEQAEFRPAPDEWSIAEVLHHLLTSSEKVATTVEALSRGESINPGRIDPPREETTQTIDELTTKLRVRTLSPGPRSPSGCPMRLRPSRPLPIRCSASCTPAPGTCSSACTISTMRARSSRTSNQRDTRGPSLNRENCRQRNVRFCR